MGKTCGRGCKVGICGLYAIVRWMERMRGRMWGEWRMRERVGNVGKGLRDKGKWGKWKWIDRDIGDVVRECEGKG